MSSDIASGGDSSGIVQTAKPCAHRASCDNARSWCNMDAMNPKDKASLRHILEFMEGRYGNLSLDQMKALVRADGFGDLVDEAEEMIGAYLELMARYATAFPDEFDHEGVEVMPPARHSEALKVELDGEILFDQKACLKTCAGNCCRGMNYLMISLPDIYRIVSSPAAKLFGVHSTEDLFRRDPPLVKLFFNEEYGLYLPYIRFLAVGADAKTLPEDAPGSVCPFLAPIEEVCAYHGRTVPEWAGEQAQGCILMRHKPKICRLSPVGKSAGLVTGRVIYEYLPPSRECPACDTNVSIKLGDYLAAAVLAGEDKLDASLHRMVMTDKRPLQREELGRYQEILKEMYNIDGLLARHGIERCHRPSLATVIDIAVEASHGNFVPYDDFVRALVRTSDKR